MEIRKVLHIFMEKQQSFEHIFMEKHEKKSPNIAPRVRKAGASLTVHWSASVG